MTTSIEREIENQLLGAITTAGVTGLNLYTSERSLKKLFPYVYAVAEINSEDLQQFTGIFSCTATIRYRERADQVSRPDFDNKFQQILQAFYTEPNIASQMTSSSPSVTFYISDISSFSPVITGLTRTWSRDILMSLKVTSKQT